MKFFKVFLPLLVVTNVVWAQQGKLDEPLSSFDGYRGSFRLWTGHDSTNVNYQITPAIVQDKATLLLHTPFAQPLWLEVFSSKGKKVYEWKVTRPGYKQEQMLDLSALPAGAYRYRIGITGQQQVFTIPFNKN